MKVRASEHTAESRRGRPRRAGVVAVLSILALVLITLICAILIRSGRARRNEVHSIERSLQADWLAEAGLERAAAKLNEDAAFKGETWDVPPESLGGASGRVEIAVEADSSHSGRRLVRVRAEYRGRAEMVVRRTKQTTIEIPGKTEGEGR